MALRLIHDALYAIKIIIHKAISPALLLLT